MSEWAWVALGYAAAGVGISGYLVMLLGRAAGLRRRAEGSR
ncbi:hypothetical protein [Pseudonocardia nigra]|nr:hypothetical protein [Pseudonocardia nigra]